MGLMHVYESWADADSRSMVPEFVVRPMHAPENLSDLHGTLQFLIYLTKHNYQLPIISSYTMLANANAYANADF